jgi:hypothetical protein
VTIGRPIGSAPSSSGCVRAASPSSEKLSLDLVYHYDLQHRAAAALRDAGIGAEPSGRSRRLGSEVDVIVGVVEILRFVQVLCIAPVFPNVVARLAQHAGGRPDRAHQLRPDHRRLHRARARHHDPVGRLSHRPLLSAANTY